MVKEDYQEAEANFKAWIKKRGVEQATHGEMYVLRNSYNQSVNKFDLHVDPSTNLPPKMSKQEASAYYNQKFRHYWLTKLDKAIPINQRERVLDLLLHAS